MPKIELTQGFEATVDYWDYENLKHFKWTAQPKHGDVYAYRMSRRTQPYEKRHIIMMHREIMQAGPDTVVDHINHNTLDNRRSNLRTCTHAENMRNRRLQKNNKHGSPGLTYLSGRRKPWRVTIRVGKNWPKYIGVFQTKGEAQVAYRSAARKYHGEFANA